MGRSTKKRRKLRKLTSTPMSSHPSRYSPQTLAEHREGASRRWRPMVLDEEESGRIHPFWSKELGRPVQEEMWSNCWYYANVVRIDEYPMFGYGSVDGPIEVRGPLVYIGLSSIDEMARHDWRDMQNVKNDIAGLDWEAVELFPADSRLVDPSNRFYLWCVPSGVLLFGFHHRRVWDVDRAVAPQRPFPKEKCHGT